MADNKNKIIRQIQVDTDGIPHDLGGSIYNLDEAATAINISEDSTGNTSQMEIDCLIFYCGTSTELV